MSLKWELSPCEKIDKIHFYSLRKEVRKSLALPYKSFKKSIFAKSTTDAYDGFHIYYNNDNKMVAVEIFNGIEIVYNDTQLFPGTLKNALQLIPDLEEKNGMFVSITNSIGISVAPDDSEIIGCILIGCENYYE